MDRSADVSVVVGVDGSMESRAAVDVGGWEAYRRGLPLRLVHGYPDAGYPPDAPQGRLDREVERISRRYPELATRSELVAGDPGTVLVDAARGAVLAVLGARGLGSFHSTLLGSVAERVAGAGAAPVILVRPPDPGSRPRIGVVVAVDGSPAAATAVEFAFEEAAARGTDLTAVSAEEPEWPDAERVLAEALAGWPDKYPQVELFRRPVPGRNPVRTLIEESAGAELLVAAAPGAVGLAQHARTSVAVVPACTRR